MLRLRACIASHLLSPPSTPAISPLRRLLSATARAPPVSPSKTTSSTPAASPDLKPSTKLSHLKSPAKPDAVLAFLAGLGLSSADVAAAIVRDPLLLWAGVERTLAPVVAGLTGLGLSGPEISRLVAIIPNHFRCRSLVSKLQYFLPLFGSPGNLLRMLESGSYLLNGTDFDKQWHPLCRQRDRDQLDGMVQALLTAARLHSLPPSR